MGTLPSTQNTFSVLLDSVCAVTAMITKYDKSQNATARIPICRILWLSHFVPVQNATSQIHVRSARGYTPPCRKHVHIDVRYYQKGFLSKSIMGFITYIHTHEQMSQWNNTKMGKNSTFHIYVKSEHGYSPKYPEHVFSAIWLSLCRHGHDHKMRQITKCDGKDSDLSHFVTVAICDDSKHNFSDWRQ